MKKLGLTKSAIIAGLCLATSNFVSLNDSRANEVGNRGVKISVVDSILQSNQNTMVVKNRLFSGDGLNTETLLSHGQYVTEIITQPIDATAGLAFDPEVYFYGGIGSNKSLSSEIYGIDQAVLNGSRIINLSLSGTGFDQGEYDALKRASDAGIIIVVASGNQGAQLKDESPYAFPCQNKIKNLICVGAYDNGEISSYSNYGANVKIYTDGNYKDKRGTSFSAPRITRALALAAENLEMNNEEIVSELYKSVRTVSSLGEKIQVFNEKEFIENISSKKRKRKK